MRAVYRLSRKMASNNEKSSQKREVDWICVAFNLQVFISCFCGVHFIFHDAYLKTTVFSFALIILAFLGVTAGSHRLWAHHTYTASTPLKIFLMLCQTLAGHTAIYHWVRLHRLHHKYYQTDLDPFCPKKGFLYSHFIANYLKLNHEQEKRLEEIDMSDLESDKVVMFQKKFYWVLYPILTLLLPINAPVEYWDESILSSVFILGWLRFGVTYHFSLLIHSASNIFDFNTRDINTYDSNWVFLLSKSYWISYHYLMPDDYQTSEFGKYGTDCTSKFIRVCAALDLASNLKTVESDTVRKALAMAAEEEKPITECIRTLQSENDSKNHRLAPEKCH